MRMLKIFVLALIVSPSFGQSFAQEWTFPSNSSNISNATDCPNNIDAMDFGPDGRYYIFSCTTVYTVGTQPVSISSVFKSIVTPVVAVFSTGPSNGKMYIIDSDPAFNLKIFGVSTNDTLPRPPLIRTSLSAVLPSASSVIPVPLTSAFASFVPPRVYFLGGTSGNRVIGMYNYDVSTGVFSFNGTTTIMQPAYAAVWDEDIKAASINYDFSSGFARFFLLSLYQTVEVDISCKITVVNGPTMSGSCPLFQPDHLNQCCPHRTPPPTPVTPVTYAASMFTTTKEITSSTSGLPATTTTTAKTTIRTTESTTATFCSMSQFCAKLPDAAVNSGPDGPDPTGGYYLSANFLLFSDGCVLSIDAAALFTGTLRHGTPAPLTNFYGTAITNIKKAFVDATLSTILDDSVTPLQQCSPGSFTTYPQYCANGPQKNPVDNLVSAYSTWYDNNSGQPFYVAVDASGQNLFVTDGAINTGSSFTILTGQSTITSVSALQHVAYTSNPDGLEVDFLYVFGTDTTGNQYFGVAQVPALRSSQDEVAAALGNLQWVVQPVPYANIYGSACGAYTVSTLPPYTTTSATSYTTHPTKTGVYTSTAKDLITSTTPFTTTTNPCTMASFCSALPDSSVNADEANGPDPAGGIYGSPNFLLFSGTCELPIDASSMNMGILTYGTPSPIKDTYSVSSTPINKAYIDSNGNTNLLSGGTVQICAGGSSPKSCSAGTALAISNTVKAYSTWLSSSFEVFYIAADNTGQNLFVTDGSSQIGSLVSIASNQSTIQTVSGLQHVSYFDNNGAEVDFLYILGKDANGLPYFGVVQLKLAPPVDTNSAAASLSEMEWVLPPQPYSNIYGSACGAQSTTSANTCKLSDFCTTSPSASIGSESFDNDPYYYMFNGPCALKYTINTIDPAMPIFTPVAGPQLSEQLFFGPESPWLAGKTIVDAFVSFDMFTNAYHYTLLDSTGNTVVCKAPTNYDTTQPYCFATGSYSAAGISDHSSWMDSNGGSIFYLVTDAAGVTIAVNDGSATSANAFPLSGSGLVNSTALQTVIGASTQGLLVFGYSSVGLAEISYGNYANNGSTFGSITGTIAITWSPTIPLRSVIAGCP